MTAEEFLFEKVGTRSKWVTDVIIELEFLQQFSLLNSLDLLFCQKLDMLKNVQLVDIM